jgi:hypothetical protein
MFGSGPYIGAESRGLFEFSVLSLAEGTAETTFKKTNQEQDFQPWMELESLQAP